MPGSTRALCCITQINQDSVKFLLYRKHAQIQQRNITVFHASLVVRIIGIVPVASKSELNV